MPRTKIQQYREKAAALRAMADREHDPRLKAELLWIARNTTI
jgi:hypothetical protein